MTHTTPPRYVRALLKLCVRGDDYEVIAGDLDEDFAATLAAGGTRAEARRRWRRQALRSIVADVAGRGRDAMSSSGPLSAGALLSTPFRELGRDVRYVARQLTRNPGYTAAAILSFTLGIGGGTAVYGVVYHLLLQPLPVERPAEIALAYWGDRAHQAPGTLNIGSLNFRDARTGIDYSSNYSYPEFLRLMRTAPKAASVCAFATSPDLTVTHDNQPAVAATGLFASGEFFTTLGPRLALGRPLDRRDDTVGAEPTAVMSYGAWVRLFGADVHALGRLVRVNGAPVVIVGILDASFQGIFRQGSSPAPDLILPLVAQPAIAPGWNRSAGNQSLFVATNVDWLRLLVRAAPQDRGRLESGFTNTYRQARLDANRSDAQTVDHIHVYLLGAERGLEGPIPTGAEQPLLILACVVAVVLVVTCLNIAGLMLTRDLARRREFAVRRAIGATPWRLVRERLVESFMLSGAGAMGGLLVARWFAPLVLGLIAGTPGTADAVGLTANGPVLTALMAVSTLAALLAGSFPALALGTSISHDGPIGRTASTRAPRLRAGRVLLAIQIAAAVPLVICAGLFLRTLRNLETVDVGFDPRSLVIVSVDPTLGDRPQEQVSAIYARLLERVSALPGVTSATLVENTLVSGASDTFSSTIDGKPARMWGNTVGPNYFQTFAIPLLAGRTFDVRDDTSGPAVAIINDNAARLYFAGLSPLGRLITLDYPRPHAVEIIGVVADTKYASLKDPIRPTMFQPYWQSPAGRMRIVLRSTTSLTALRAPIVSAVADIDPNLPVTGMKTQAEQIGDTISREQLMAAAVTSFSGVVLALVCVGLYGVTSHLAGQRTAEIGIRLALGARRPQVVWLIVRQMAVASAAGLAVGLVVAWIAAPVVRSMLFGLAARDPGTIGLASILIAVAALGATLKPARKAARADPLVSLRES